MAILSTIECVWCGKTSSETHSASSSPPDLCSSCRNKKRENAKEKHLSELAELPIDVRINRLEEKLYEMEKEREISRLDDRRIG